MIEANKIYNENCLDTMRKMPDGVIDLTVISPPYDNLRTYNGYVFPFEDIARELYRVTKDGGVVVWIVSDATINGSESLSSFKQAIYFVEQCGFKLYDTMIWNKPSPQAPTHNRYYDVFEYMFILSKGTPKTLNLLVDRLNSSSGGKCKKETRSSKENREYNGTRIIAEKSRRFNVWNISRGSSETTHPAVFPEKLAADHIYSWSNEGELVYDPFGGSGTTAKMANQLNRRWILSEISAEYCEIAQKRISAYMAQTKLF